MRINVKNVGRERFVSPSGNTLTSNSIDVGVAGLGIELQRSVPNQREISYAEGVGMRTLGTPLFQVVRQFKHLSVFRRPPEIIQATNQYRDLLTARPNSLGDWHLQYPQRVNLTQSDRSIVHQIQINAGALILSDVEIDREQDESAFESDIVALKNQYPNKVVCPTIDTGTRTDGLFGRKVDKILKNGFDRFNVINRSIENTNNFPNWIDLSEKILGKDVWCNVVGAPLRWHGRDRIAQISRPFLFGVHSVSLGLPWMYGKVKPFTLNGQTFCFDQAPAGVSYGQARADSVLTQDRELGTARSNTINGTFFRRYVPSRYGLHISLRSFM